MATRPEAGASAGAGILTDLEVKPIMERFCGSLEEEVRKRITLN